MTDYTARDVRNSQTFGAWMLGSMAVFIAATLLIDGKYIPPIGGWALTLATLVLMLGAVRSYIVFLREADELLRKVHLEALAFAFGAGMVAMMCWRLCERLGAPKLDVNDAALVMMLCWVAGQWLGGRRYTTAVEES